MDLYLVRHAWAEKRDDRTWPDDAQRPLTDEGTVRFGRVAAVLAERDVAPEVIATSPLVRCVQTAAILAEALGGEPEVVQREGLEPQGRLKPLLRWTARQAEHYDEIAWVGHAPDVAEHAAALIGEGDGMIRFAKGAIALIRFDGEVAAGAGELRWLATAKMLGC